MKYARNTINTRKSNFQQKIFKIEIFVRTTFVGPEKILQLRKIASQFRSGSEDKLRLLSQQNEQDL